MTEHDSIYLAKAVESLEGAQNALLNGRYNNCANRCYYSAFQAAIAALQRVGIRPAGQWGHEFVQGRFEGQLIYRRKLYPTELRGMLEDLRMLRRVADYAEDVVSRTETERALRRARLFATTILGGEHQ